MVKVLLILVTLLFSLTPTYAGPAAPGCWTACSSMCLLSSLAYPLCMGSCIALCSATCFNPNQLIEKVTKEGIKIVPM